MMKSQWSRIVKDQGLLQCCLHGTNQIAMPFLFIVVEKLRKGAKAKLIDLRQQTSQLCTRALLN